MGKIPILTNIFQRGWNHQLEIHVVLFKACLKETSTFKDMFHCNWQPLYDFTFQNKTRMESKNESLDDGFPC